MNPVLQILLHLIILMTSSVLSESDYKEDCVKDKSLSATAEDNYAHCTGETYCCKKDDQLGCCEKGKSGEMALIIVGGVAGATLFLGSIICICLYCDRESFKHSWRKRANTQDRQHLEKDSCGADDVSDPADVSDVTGDQSPQPGCSSDRSSTNTSDERVSVRSTSPRHVTAASAPPPRDFGNGMGPGTAHRPHTSAEFGSQNLDDSYLRPPFINPSWPQSWLNMRRKLDKPVTPRDVWLTNNSDVQATPRSWKSPDMFLAVSRQSDQ